MVAQNATKWLVLYTLNDYKYSKFGIEKGAFGSNFYEQLLAPQKCAHSSSAY